MQAGLWIITRSLYDRFPADLPVDGLCRRLDIGRGAAYGEAGRIAGLLLSPREPDSDHDARANRELREKDFEIDILRYERDHPGCRTPGIRMQFDSDYKGFVDKRRSHYEVTIERASQILMIPVDSLKKFSRFANVDAAPESNELPKAVVELVNEFLRSGQRAKTVKKFCERNPELLGSLGMNYRQVVAWLRKLGFVSHRGIFLKNKGLDKILRFKPNQVWGTDGKNLIITVNGEIFHWVWQCLVDYKTTVIVGGVINRDENTENLLDAIKGAKQKTGITPLAIVMDNRLSENLSAVRVYLAELGIEVIKTYPGNAKSNGIVEGNFNIFDRWVGSIEINASSPEQISLSVAQAFVEVFTQMRNQRPRKALFNKSPKDVMDQTPPASPAEVAQVREKLNALANRLKNEQATPIISTQKQAAIEQAVQKTNPPQPEAFAKALKPSCYTADLILGSLAIFERQKAAYPEKSYGHSYFGGILRRSVDQQNVEALNINLEAVYANHWETMSQLLDSDRAGSLQTHPTDTCTRLAIDFMNMPVPAFANRVLVDLKEAFFLASRASTELAVKLRQTIAQIVIDSKKATTEKRETLLRKIFEWDNFVRLCDRQAAGSSMAPAGNA